MNGIVYKRLLANVVIFFRFVVISCQIIEHEPTRIGGKATWIVRSASKIYEKLIF